MDLDGDLEQRLRRLWQVLEQKGLVGKKLAVFTEDDATEIASQACAELGIICEALFREPIDSHFEGNKDYRPHKKGPRASTLHFRVCLHCITILVEDRF